MFLGSVKSEKVSIPPWTVDILMDGQIINVKIDSDTTVSQGYNTTEQNKSYIEEAHWSVWANYEQKQPWKIRHT